MVGINRSFGFALLIALALIGTVPLLMGQGCIGNNVEPIQTDWTKMGDSIIKTPADPTGNQAPEFEFSAPMADVSVEVGDPVTISWMCRDPDDNASISILLDPDGNFGNGNERVVVPLVLEDSGLLSYELDTAAQNLPPASYRIIAKVNDNINPELLTVAPGHILMFGAGLLPGNIAPSIQVLQPTTNIGMSQGETLTVDYCARDRDNPGPDNTEAVPDIVILLDYDNNPNNDLDLISDGAESRLGALCAGGLPASIPGGIVIACATKNGDCTNPNNPPNPADPADPQQVAVQIDVGLIPPTPSGDPYRIRATIWDHVNLPVHSYAPGTLSITALGSGVVDLAAVGRSVSGSKFMGFASGDLAGSTTLDVGDFDSDGADDFLIVERYGSPYGVGNIGGSRFIFGMPGQKFGSEIPLNSVPTSIRGTYIPVYSGYRAGCGVIGNVTIPGLTGTQGITSVARVSDVNNDGRPEIIYGMPWLQQFWDMVNDDPCKCGCPEGDCYFGGTAAGTDGLPNPWSAECAKGCGVQYMGAFDERENSVGGDEDEPGFMCSNDLTFSRATPIEGGYAVLVGSEDTPAWDYTIRGLNHMGQRTDVEQFPGARFRGGWYDIFDLTQTKRPYIIIPDNSFGQTVRTMPLMRNTSLSISPRYGNTLLISAPMAAGGKGTITYVPPQNWMAFRDNDSQSFPVYSCCSNCPGPARCLSYPSYLTLTGAAVGDEFGYADAAGDYNLDGSRDIVCGAPGADRNGFVDNGIVYIIFGRPDFGEIDLGVQNPPRMEIRGANTGDRFGEMQTIVGDINQDGLPDIGLASKRASGPGGPESGFVGVIFGGRKATGENTFTVNQIATSQLPGVKFYGSQVGGHAGAVLGNGGDVNGDGIDDMLICAPNETRSAGGQVRRGVAYVVFGGPHLSNMTFSLNQVGTSALPGMIIVSPYADGIADTAPVDWVGPAGDVNADGFADILVGVSKADYINPLEPTQRRIDSGECYLIYGSNTGSNSMN